jgi:zinc protease
VRNSGVGSLDKFAVSAFLKQLDGGSGESATLSVYVRDDEEGMEGNAGIDRFEGLLQLMYRYFTQPRRSEAAFEDWKSRELLNLREVMTPQEAFTNDIGAIVGDALSGRKAPGILQRLEGLEKTRLDTAHRIYRERFANAGDFTFVVTGDFDVQAMAPLLARYLGALPDAGKREAAASREEELPDSPFSQVFHASQPMEGALVELDFIGPAPSTASKDSAALTGLSRVLDLVLNQRLRYREGGTYHVLVVSAQYKSVDRYRMKIRFDCTADKVESLIAAALEEIDSLKNSGPEEAVFRQAITAQQRSYFDNKFNYDVRRVLVRQYSIGEDPRELLRQQELLDSLTPQDLQAAASKYLDQGRFFRFVMKPGN